MSGSTLFLVEEYTIACWTVHYFLVGEYPMTNRHVFSTFAGVFVVGSMIAHSILAKQYTIASFRGKRPNKIPEVVMQLWAHPRYCVASASLVEQSLLLVRQYTIGDMGRVIWVGFFAAV